MKYVQHKSGVGEKWEVIQDYDDSWRVEKHGTVSKAASHWLPKSEYLEVPAPERWEDVTSKCHTHNDTHISYEYGLEVSAVAHCYGGYRLRKVQGTIWIDTSVANPVGWAFIVEKQVSL